MHQSSEKEKGTWRYQVAEAAELPKDVILNVPFITLTGNIEIMIENHKGILSYHSEEVKIATKCGLFYVTGANLVINYYRDREIKINGRIKQVYFS